jgi:hypothetical protein
MMDYQEFLASKAPVARPRGLDNVPTLAKHLRPDQAHCVDFHLRFGGGGLFLDTGLGKTAVQLEWSRIAAEASNGRALLLTPLAVADQIRREAIDRWGYDDVRVIRSQDDAGPGINICNYDRLHTLDVSTFGAVSLDESSILKSFTGKTTRALIDSFAGHRFKLAATATPAPNDHMELGTHAEFLGVMQSNEMLSRWFINDTSTASQEWRLKGHAVELFWDWVASWARMASLPSDLGGIDDGFVLLPLNVVRHRVETEAGGIGGLFGDAPMSATDMHRVKRDTATGRAARVADLVSGTSDLWVIWCDTDYEADALAALIPSAEEVRGSHPIDRKERTLARFADGSFNVLITKPSICGYGLNWQHCHNTAFVGRTFSYEAWYQAVRRLWRFGQDSTVNVHLIVAEGEDQIGRVIDRKAADHDTMKTAMRAAMRRVADGAQIRRVPYQPNYIGRLPSWLSAA